jgi:PRP38 family
MRHLHLRVLMGERGEGGVGAVRSMKRRERGCVQIGFLYLRYVCPPEHLLDWFQPHFTDQQVRSVNGFVDDLLLAALLIMLQMS